LNVFQKLHPACNPERKLLSSFLITTLLPGGFSLRGEAYPELPPNNFLSILSFLKKLLT
jgi:hypothetical protein